MNKIKVQEQIEKLTKDSIFRLIYKKQSKMEF